MDNLRGALDSSTPLIRALAANKLAEDHDVSSSGVIKAALDREQDSQTAAEIASALVALGDAAGSRYPVRLCTDGSSSRELVVLAATYLSPAKLGEECVAPLVKTLSRETNEGVLIQLMQVLGSLLDQASAGDHKEILASAQSLLASSSPSVRLMAAQALSTTGDAAAVPLLAEAIAREQDMSVKASMEQDLSRLQQAKQ